MTETKVTAAAAATPPVTPTSVARRALLPRIFSKAPPTGAMDRLEESIQRVLAAGGRFRQDFPPDCVPLVRGAAVAPLETYLTA